MSEKNSEKDIMEGVINDISAAREEAVEETAEALQDVAGMVAEAAAEQAAAQPDTIVVKFADELDAARAVRVINNALRTRRETIYQGAMISRRGENGLDIQDLRDMGLTDVITGTAGLGLDLARDGLRLALTAAKAGASLVGSGFKVLRKTALEAANLAGSTRTIPQRRRLEAFYAVEELEDSAAKLEPGTTAVVIVADHETANELATDLVRSGGELA